MWSSLQRPLLLWLRYKHTHVPVLMEAQLSGVDCQTACSTDSASSELHSATRLTSCLLRMPAVPLDTPASVGRPADMLQQGPHQVWALQDHPEGPGHRRLVLDGRRCKKKVAAWSQVVVGQLGEGHRALFPAILTDK